MKNLFKEPFIHFMAMGLLLFLLYSLVNESSESREDIVIDINDIESYTAKWEMQWKRPPTQEELANLVVQNIKQEVFYQEALKLNLDHNDEIIKRRLSQKMEFLSNDLATLAEPSGEELEVYFNENSEKYLSPYRYSLYQIVFSYDRHENPDETIVKVLEKANTATIEAMESEGDNLPFPFHYKNVDSRELSRELGSVFTDNLKSLELNNWIGPVASGFGKHLVYITDMEKPRLPDLSSVKEEVLRDFQYEKQKEMNDLIFENLKTKYKINFVFDDSESAKAFKTLLDKKLEQG